MDTLRTLVLTPSIMPHRICYWQESICLLYSGKIDVLENYEAKVSSPSITFNVPAVVRLKREVSSVKKGVKFSRSNILTRDHFKCCYCGLKFLPSKLNYDHVLPSSKGGKTDWLNIVASCFPCNKKKGNKTPEQAGMKMHFKPYRPKVLPMTQPFLLLAKDIPDIWKPYLKIGMQESA